MSRFASMQVRLRLPARLVCEIEARKLAARAENGGFGVLPNHVDFVTALAPDVLILVEPGGRERFFGIDEGVLVKQGREVEISVRRAIEGEDLAGLKRRVREVFVDLDERERSARTALARLEADMVRRFAELRDAP